MRDIGVTRRRPMKKRSGLVELPLKPLTCLQPPFHQSGLEPNAMEMAQANKIDAQFMIWQELAVLSAEDLPLLDDRALLDPYIRTMSCRMDPFGTASVHIDSTVRGLLEYFVFYTSTFPNTWTYCPAALHYAPSGPRISTGGLVSAAFEDDLMMHCILSAAASRIYYVDGIERPWWSAADVHSTQHALHLLQERIPKAGIEDLEARERLVSSILHLGGAAFYKRDFSTAKVHATAAVRIAELEGSIRDLQDPFIRGRLLSLDDLISCAEMVPCAANCMYDPGPASTLGDLEQIMVNTNDEDLVAESLLQDENITSVEIRDLTIHIRECHIIQLRVAQCAKLSSPQKLDVKHWLTMRTLAIRNRLLALTCDNTQEETLRVALIMWTLLPPHGNVKRYARIAQTLAPRLRSLLSPRSDVKVDTYEKSRLWYLLLGNSCSQEDTETQQWFAEEIHEMIRLIGGRLSIGLDAGLTEHLIDFQKRYFFHEGLLTPVTERLAQWLLWNDASV